MTSILKSKVDIVIYSRIPRHVRFLSVSLANSVPTNRFIDDIPTKDLFIINFFANSKHEFSNVCLHDFFQLFIGIISIHQPIRIMASFSPNKSVASEFHTIIYGEFECINASGQIENMLTFVMSLFPLAAVFRCYNIVLSCSGIVIFLIKE